jgi:hypothetical protein
MNGMLEALIVWSLVLSVVWSFLLGPSGIAKICGILIWSDVYIVDSWCIFPFLISSLEYVSIPNLTALLSELCDEVLCWAQISAFVDIRFHRLRELGSLLLIVLGVHSSTISTVRIYVIYYGHELWSPSTHLIHTPNSLYTESYLPSHTIPFCSPTFAVTNGSNYDKKSSKCTHMFWTQMQHDSCCPCI